MGCGSSTSTAVVEPLVPDEDDTESKHSGRGDSAVSKGTTDSGVVMENREIPTLPGTVPRKLPPLTSAEVSPPLLKRESESQERRKSSEILEELLNQGIILNPSHESSSTVGEAYSIMLNDGERALKRPPARLESLKANKTQQLSREEIDEKIRLAENRRKQKEEEMKSRLRAKSARVRVPSRTVSTDHIEGLTAPAQVSPPPAEGSNREAKVSVPQSDKKHEMKGSGENDVIPITQDGELSDADSDISFQPATANDDIF